MIDSFLSFVIQKCRYTRKKPQNIKSCCSNRYSLATVHIAINQRSLNRIC